eukprot:6110007-Amphidinium_carterae.1
MRTSQAATAIATEDVPRAHPATFASLAERTCDFKRSCATANAQHWCYLTSGYRLQVHCVRHAAQTSNIQVAGQGGCASQGTEEHCDSLERS